MSLVVPSTPVAILNCYVPPDVGPTIMAPISYEFRWEGSRVASVDWLQGTAPFPHPNGNAYRVRLDKPTGECFPTGTVNVWPPKDGLGLRWTCAGQGTALEDRSEWYVSAEKAAEAPFSFSMTWHQLPSGARSDAYYPPGGP